MSSNLIDEYCSIIDTYSGRDKVMKALCYGAKLIAGCHVDRNKDLAKRYANISSQISSARATLRLIDDIPMIQYALEYGFGPKEAGRIEALLGVVTNMVDLLYYPIEKICWLSDHKAITLNNPDRWDVLSSIFWVLSVYLNLMRTLVKLSSILKNNDKNKCKKRTFLTLNSQHIEYLTVLRLTLDLVHAVSSLPKGYFWGSKLTVFEVGAIGTLSAAIGIFQIFAKRSLSK